MAAKRCIIPLLRVGRRAWLPAAAAVLLAVSFYLVFKTPPSREPDAALPAPCAVQYDVVLRRSVEEASYGITETVRFRNDTGDTLETLVLRTWLNAYADEASSPAALEELYDGCYPEGFSAGYLDVYDVIWKGERVPYTYVNEDRTAMEIDVPPLEDGETGEMILRCVAHLPLCAHRAGRTGEEDRLGNVLPLLSRYENHAWRTDTYSAIGDPFVSDCADFKVTLHIPDGYVPACSALLSRDESGAWRGELLSARDLALAVSPAYKTASGKAGRVQVYSFAKTEAAAKRALDDACSALETFSSLYGPYPYPTFTVCSVDFPFGGMEYPGLCMIGERNYLESMADTLELIVAHETAHQWFYALVGSDQVNDPWQDEAICEYAMLRYIRERYGQGSFETLKYYRVDAPMRENIPGMLTPGSPVDYFGNLSDYSAVVYGRGAALLLALEEMLPGGVDGFLRKYAETFSYGYATRGAFEALLNEYAGEDLHPLLVDYLDTVP